MGSPHLQEFQSLHYVDVRVTRMAWEEAWPKLLNLADATLSISQTLSAHLDPLAKDST